MPSRRDFLGSVIGTIVVSGMSFKAIAGPSFQPYDEDDTFCKLLRMIEFLKSPRELQMAARILLRLSDETVIRGPAIESIEQPNVNMMMIHGYKLEMKQTVTAKGFILINHKNQLISEMFFLGGHCCYTGSDEHETNWRKRNPGQQPTKKDLGGDKLVSTITLNVIT